MVEVGRREPYENPIPSWEVRGGIVVGVRESRAHQDEDGWRRPPACGNEPEQRYSAHAQAVHRACTVEAEEMGRKAPHVCEEMDQRGRAGCGESVRRGYAVLNPWYNQERIGGRPLGHLTDRMSKDLWDKSMLEKQETLEDAYRAVLQGPRDMVKATLPEPQFPAVQAHTHGHSV